MDKIDNKTLAQHAEEWWQEQGQNVPLKDTVAYEEMYQKWVEFAFRSFDT